jgi:hypothetical protein
MVEDSRVTVGKTIDAGLPASSCGPRRTHRALKSGSRRRVVWLGDDTFHQPPATALTDGGNTVGAAVQPPELKLAAVAAKTSGRIMTTTTPAGWH